MNGREWAKAWLPPALMRLRRRWSGQLPRFSGRIPDWSQALALSKGYADDSILERVTKASRAVVAGHALYERDSVLFHEATYRFPVVSALLRAAALNEGRLDVVDVGGALGGLYRQCRPFLGPLRHMSWQVVEQPSFVSAGSKEFATDELSFVGSFAELARPPTAPVILASSVLQYLERPHEVMQEMSAMTASTMVIDRTPLSAAATDQLSIQRVPDHIYAASYPCWIISRSRLLSRLAEHWNVLVEFPCDEGQDATDDGLRFEFRGLILERKR